MNITIQDDSILEDNEEFSVVLSSNGVTVLPTFPTMTVATVSIIDNDGKFLTLHVCRNLFYYWMYFNIIS